MHAYIYVCVSMYTFAGPFMTVYFCVCANECVCYLCMVVCFFWVCKRYFLCYKWKGTENALSNLSVDLYISIYICIYEVNSITFQTFFVWAFKIVLESWKFSMLLLFILWDDWPIFMISDSKEQRQKQLNNTLLKLDCQSSRILKCNLTLQKNYMQWHSVLKL